MTRTKRTGTQLSAETQVRALHHDAVTLLEATATLEAGYGRFDPEQQHAVLDIAQRHLDRIRDGLDALRRSGEP